MTGFGKIAYQASQKIKIGLEYSLLRNGIKMPGGLTDEQFDANSRTSVRSRNWLKSPWNVLTASLDYAIHSNTSLQVVSTFLAGERSLVWVNKLPGEPDITDHATGQFSDREIDREIMKSTATEIRLLHNYHLGNMKSAVATGLRFSVAGFNRKEEAIGSNKSDFDLTAATDYEEKYHFTTTNIAAFVENCLQVSDRFSITPGLRFESLATEAEAEIEVNGIEKETESEKERSFLLLALGLQYKAEKTAVIYGNITQAYRPVDYAQLVPLGSVSRVDPDMKDPKGWNADIGVRGNTQGIVNYDIGLFYLSYNNRIGLVSKRNENGDAYTLRTNIDKSIHKGVESYIELNVSRALSISKKLGDVRVYNSFAYTSARYTRGVYTGNQVEYAPAVINRIGLLYNKGIFSTALQFSSQSKAYGDAANTELSSNPIVGSIPAYQLIDWSATVSYKKMKCKGGVNNLTDKKFFTQRTDEYPGPGIIPSTGRTWYLGFGYNL